MRKCFFQIECANSGQKLHAFANRSHTSRLLSTVICRWMINNDFNNYSAMDKAFFRKCNLSSLPRFIGHILPQWAIFNLITLSITHPVFLRVSCFKFIDILPFKLVLSALFIRFMIVCNWTLIFLYFKLFAVLGHLIFKNILRVFQDL